LAPDLVNDNFAVLTNCLRGLKKMGQTKKRGKPMKVCRVFFTAIR
jgi:hypothetical protein